MSKTNQWKWLLAAGMLTVPLVLRPVSPVFAGTEGNESRNHMTAGPEGIENRVNSKTAPGPEGIENTKTAAGSAAEPRTGSRTGSSEVFLAESEDVLRRYLLETASARGPGERHEVWVTGAGFTPLALPIAQFLPRAVNISNTPMEEYKLGGKRHVTCRIGFEIREEDGSRTEDGSGPGLGQGTEGAWRKGDVQTRWINGVSYDFTCVDDAYQGNSDHQYNALFLCDTVIRSDVDSTESKKELIPFGENNNYITSAVRNWLGSREISGVEQLSAVETGVNSAWMGQTEPGAFGDFSENRLTGKPLPVQRAEDRLFLLSMEEALEYREFLWDAERDGSAHSRGYWLRTPVWQQGENGSFSYGDLIYGVDLDQGMIRPALVSDVSMGIRPAYCLPQQ